MLEGAVLRVSRAALETALEQARAGAVIDRGVWLPVIAVEAAPRPAAPPLPPPFAPLERWRLCVHVVARPLEKRLEAMLGAGRGGAPVVELRPNLRLGADLETCKVECGVLDHKGAWLKPWPSAWVIEQRGVRAELWSDAALARLRA